jgi:hypothetical protein
MLCARAEADRKVIAIKVKDFMLNWSNLVRVSCSWVSGYRGAICKCSRYRREKTKGDINSDSDGIVSKEF